MKKIIVGLAVLCGILGVYFLYVPNKEDREGLKRQQLEEVLADKYIQELKNEETKENSSIKENSQIEEKEKWEDNNWYVKDGITYTPQYAKGNIDCVLEIEKIRLRRGVYIGTWEDIYHNLDMWMVTSARPDYRLGTTHYVIYGHNHTRQNLSFNRLKDLEIEDTFILISDKGIFHYIVTEIFSDWRENITKKVVDNMNLTKEYCYIITCGRNEHRYKDLVVVGKLDRIENDYSVIKGVN